MSLVVGAALIALGMLVLGVGLNVVPAGMQSMHQIAAEIQTELHGDERYRSITVTAPYGRWRRVWVDGWALTQADKFQAEGLVRAALEKRGAYDGAPSIFSSVWTDEFRDSQTSRRP